MFDTGGVVHRGAFAAACGECGCHGRHLLGTDRGCRVTWCRGRRRTSVGLSGGLEHLVERRQVVDALEVGLLQQTRLDRVRPPRCCRVAASGSSVIWMDFHAGSRTSAGSALPESFFSAALAAAFALSGLALIQALVFTEPRSTRLDDVRVLLEERLRDDDVRDHELLARPQVCSRRAAPSPPSATSLEAVGSGTQAPSMEPDL